MRLVAIATIVGCTATGTPTVIAPTARRAPPVMVTHSGDPWGVETVATVRNCSERGFALDNQRAYIACNDTRVVAIDFETRNQQVLLPASNSSARRASIALDGARLYFASTDTVSWVDTASGVVTRAASFKGPVFALAARGGAVVFGAHNGIYRIANGAPQLVCAADLPQLLVIDGTDVYFEDLLASTAGSHLFAASLTQPGVADLGKMRNFDRFVVAGGILYVDSTVGPVGLNTRDPLFGGQCHDYVADDQFVFVDCGAVYARRIGASQWAVVGKGSGRTMAINDRRVCLANPHGEGHTRISCIPRPAALRP